MKPSHLLLPVVLGAALWVIVLRAATHPGALRDLSILLLAFLIFGVFAGVGIRDERRSARRWDR